MASPTVIVPYQDWIGYNVLKTLAEYPLISSAVVAVLSALGTYMFVGGNDPSEPGMKPWQSTLLSAIVTFVITYAILWYYGSTLFA